MTLYIDSDYRLHVQPAPGLSAVELPEMDGKCRAYIEGYRYVPEGQTWTREDGEVFAGAMLAPAVSYAALEMAQKGYDEAKAEIADMQAALNAIYSGEVKA